MIEPSPDNTLPTTAYGPIVPATASWLCLVRFPPLVPGRSSLTPPVGWPAQLNASTPLCAKD
ncbi:MAG TPA: hypothetical protein VGH53_10620, partial [Streptosporangiaceae bacterium]